MAVKFKQVKDELEAAPLTAAELKLIDIIEKYIDEKILKEFDNRPIHINLNYTEFVWNPITNSNFENIKDTRKKLMTKELYRRFEAAGWVWKINSDYSNSGVDYWVLTGK